MINYTVKLNQDHLVYPLVVKVKPRYSRQVCCNGTILNSRPAGKLIFLRSELEFWLRRKSSDK